MRNQGWMLHSLRKVIDGDCCFQFEYVLPKEFTDVGSYYLLLTDRSLIGLEIDVGVMVWYLLLTSDIITISSNLHAREASPKSVINNLLLLYIFPLQYVWNVSHYTAFCQLYYNAFSNDMGLINKEVNFTWYERLIYTKLSVMTLVDEIRSFTIDILCLPLLI